MEPAPAVQAYCYLTRLNTGFWVTFMVVLGQQEQPCMACLLGVYRGI